MLELNDLGEGRTPAITSAVGKMLAEAAGVCLEAEGHAPGVHLLVRGYLDASYRLLWPLITVQALRTWNNRERATEFGAEGIALLLAEQELGYAVIECSRRGTGFDYWMGIESAGTFQRKARLEVSGIRQGDDRVVRTRVWQKLRQTDRSDAVQLPAYVIVVEFGKPLAQVQKK